MATIEIYSKPTYLYRYRSLRPEAGPPLRDRMAEEMDALLRGYVFCSNFQAMNDPMEGMYKSSRRVREEPNYEEVAADILNEKLGAGIASFAETWDHELMWAHYADGFRGICVAYNLTRLLARLPAVCALSRVRYGEGPHTLNLSGLRDRRARARAVLSTKSVLWSYEREWRMFAGRTGKIKLAPGAVAHVYLGSRIPEADREQVTEVVEGLGIEVRATRINGYAIEQDSN